MKTGTKRFIAVDIVTAAVCAMAAGVPAILLAVPLVATAHCAARFAPKLVLIEYLIFIAAFAALAVGTPYTVFVKAAIAVFEACTITIAVICLKYL